MLLLRYACTLLLSVFNVSVLSTLMLALCCNVRALFRPFASVFMSNRSGA